MVVSNPDREYAESVDRWSSSQAWSLEAQSLLWRCRLRTGDLVLDVGTNTGRMLSLIEKLGSYPTGVEPNPEARGLAKIGHDWSLYEDVPQAVRAIGQFDIVTLVHVLGHAAKPEDLLFDCCTAVKELGTVGLILPNPAYGRLMAPKNLLTGYRDDKTFKHALSVKDIESMMPKYMSVVEEFHLGDKADWLPDTVQREEWRSRLGIVLRRNRMAGVR